MLQRLGFPSVGRHRRFVTAVGIDAVGSGVFMPISVLYFLASTDLGLVQVGAAISVASLISLPLGPLIGGVVDRAGAKQVLLAGNLLQCLGFVAYLFVDSLPAVVAAVLVTTVGRTAFWGSYGNIVAAISAPGERERWFGFLGALRNLGFAIGGLASGVAISIGTAAAYDVVVALNAASFALAFLLLLAVPPAVPARADQASGEPAGGWSVVLADRPYRLLWLAQLAYSTSMQVLNIAIPVYATTVLGLPGWVSGAVFTINCAMVGLGQGLIVRSMTGRLRWRILVLANAVFAASYVVLLGASAVSVTLGVGVVVVGSMLYTVGELTAGPVTSALAAEAAPEHLRGRYLSLIQLAWNLSSTVAPVSFAWLLDRGPAPLWLVMLGVAVAGIVVSVLLGRALPLAAAPVTNRAEDADAPGTVATGVEAG